MRVIRFCWLSLVALLGVALLNPSAAGQAAVKKTTPKKTAAKSMKKSTTARKTLSTRSKAQPKSRRVTTKQRARPPVRQSFRAGQQAPTQERYTEIQQALSVRGYLADPPDGKWDAKSADALRRFQQDQNLHADGKLNSLSLIALGLGPRRGAMASSPPPPPARAKETK